MGGNMFGGYAIFSSALTRTELIAITLKAMELGPDEFQVRLPDEDGYPRLPSEGMPLRIEEPPERAMALLAQDESGVIRGKSAKSPEIYWLEPAIESHPLITFWVYDNALSYEKRPHEVESYVARWLQLCEQGRALFAYFCPFEHMFERDRLEEKLWPAFKYGTMLQLLERAMPSWLVYMGPELAERWREEKRPSPSLLYDEQDLPSGAHFFRTTRDVFGADRTDFPVYPEGAPEPITQLPAQESAIQEV